jgi:sugar/nucleoside kinase (ribokinase family)
MTALLPSLPPPIGQYTSRMSRSTSQEGAPAVVVVGAAARDVDRGDPRGWRLGGGVAYGALTLARLGLRVGALVGLDPAAAEAVELELLRSAGVSLVGVPLARGPVFENREVAGRRIQHCLAVSDPLPVGALPDGWRRAPGWLFAPVADELGEEWAAVPPPAGIVGLGWQGLLRELSPGRRTRRRPPRPSPLLARADLVGVSRDDLDPDVPISAIVAPLAPGATLALTAGPHGGLILAPSPTGRRWIRYPALAARRTVDPTGAGDVFLAVLLAVRLGLLSSPVEAGEGPAGGGARRVDGSAPLDPGSHPGLGLGLAAAAGSLVVEAPGLLGVPSLAQIRRRIAAGGGDGEGPTTADPTGEPTAGEPPTRRVNQPLVEGRWSRGD